MPPIRFLGLISFSLYLVHEPVLLLVAGATRNPTASLFITLPLSIALAAAFWYLVERPAHRLSRRVKAGAQSEPARVAKEQAPAGSLTS
jgi:peptidoglycan/LPS O-acetylase OafA/YrhL